MGGTDEAQFAVIDTFVRIPVSGGRTLAARLWRADTREGVPAIIDVSPYRAFDLFRPLEEALLPWWAQRGYAVLAVDDAGSGGSTGLLLDEYLALEIDDAVAVVAWCAEQDWCDGGVGMSGLSWAAFTALRASIRRPPALKAMVLGGVSEDGWVTDIQNLGGATYAARVDWAGVMMMFNALPPDPQQLGEGWRDEWLARLAANRPWIETWLSHPEQDAYWAGKCADLTDPPDIPLLLYSGFADKYATSVLRIAQAWRGPVRTILGPWDHTVPNVAGREPRIGFLQEAQRWWDRWLKGVETGVMDEAPLRLWVGSPDAKGATAEGRWVGLDLPANGQGAEFVISAEGGLSEGAELWTGSVALRPAARSPQRLFSDLYEDAPAPFDLEHARREGAALFMSGPAPSDREIVAAPVLRCRVTSDAAGGQLVARLADVAPDGTAVRMTIGALNLALLAGGSRAAPPAPGEEIAVTLPFQATAWRLAAGHRLALALSADGWPTLWPDRTGATLRVRSVSLSLPLTPATELWPAPTFPPPATAASVPPGPLQWIDPAAESLLPSGVAADVAREATGTAHHLAATGTDYFTRSRFELALADGGRQAVAVKITRAAFERPGWSIRTDTRLVVRSTAAAFEIAWTVRATHNGDLVFDRSDASSVPRTAV